MWNALLDSDVRMSTETPINAPPRSSNAAERQRVDGVEVRKPWFAESPRIQE